MWLDVDFPSNRKRIKKPAEYPSFPVSKRLAEHIQGFERRDDDAWHCYSLGRDSS